MCVHVETYIHAEDKQFTRPSALDLDIVSTYAQPASCRARTMNEDDGLEDIKWIRGLGAQVASGIVRSSPKPEKVYLRSERDRDFVACFLHNSAKMCLCQTPGRHQPLITGCFVNTAVRGPASDAISIRAVVVCVPLLLYAGWRQHTYFAVPSFLLKPGNPPYPCPASEARAPVCRTWLTK